jgi:hypothetical protein
VTVKDDLVDDFPHVYPGLERPEVERLLTLLDQSASTEGAMSLSIATAVKPLVPDVARRLESYKGVDADEYVRMLRGAVVQLLQKWQSADQAPGPETVADAIDTVADAD